jgi:hypothetical protein
LRDRSKIDLKYERKLSMALTELAEKIEHSLGVSAHRCVEGLNLELYRLKAPTPPVACSYEPSLLIVPQGLKRVELGKMAYSLGRTMSQLRGAPHLVTALVTALCQPLFCMSFPRLSGKHRVNTCTLKECT